MAEEEPSVCEWYPSFARSCDQSDMLWCSESNSSRVGTLWYYAGTGGDESGEAPGATGVFSTI